MIQLSNNDRLLSVIEKAKPAFDRLKRLYERIPATTCNRQARCCRLMPEVSYVEFLHVLEALGRLAQHMQTETMEKTIKYFFLNAVRIDHCPFLDHDACRIYESRPFTCRAYGLWSRGYYETLVAENKKAKEPVRAGWETLGIKLPADVIAYQPTYCDGVTIISGDPITDTEMDRIQAQILNLDSQCGLEPGMKQFREVFLSDPSFFLTSTIMGCQSCLVEKITVVREYLSKKWSPRLKQLLEEMRECNHKS